MTSATAQTTALQNLIARIGEMPGQDAMSKVIRRVCLRAGTG